MAQLSDSQMANVADFDCFSQVFFESVEDYKRMKEDPWYKAHLAGDHENFADMKRSKYVGASYSCSGYSLKFHRMTIGWVEEFVRDGKVVDEFK